MPKENLCRNITSFFLFFSFFSFFQLMHYTTKGPGERTVSLRCFIRRRFLRCPSPPVHLRRHVIVEPSQLPFFFFFPQQRRDKASIMDGGWITRPRGSAMQVTYYHHHPPTHSRPKPNNQTTENESRVMANSDGLLINDDESYTPTKLSLSPLQQNPQKKWRNLGLIDQV